MLANAIPALALVIPVLGVLIELVFGRGDGSWRTTTRRVVVGAYLIVTLVGSAWPQVGGGQALGGLDWNWAPGLDFVLSWQFTPVHCAVLALSCFAWWSALHGASARVAFGANGLQLALTSALTAGDLLVAVASLILLASFGIATGSAGAAVGRRSAARLGRASTLEWAIASAAGISLCISVGLATHVATHHVWYYDWIELESITFPPGVQQQGVVLVLLCVAPFVGLLPFGGASLRLGESLGSRGVHWRSAAPLAGAAVWSQSLRSLAPRTGVDWAHWLIAAFIISSWLRVRMARGRQARASGRAPTPARVGGTGGTDALTPLLLGGGILALGSEWGSYALWLAMAAHLCQQALDLRASTLSRYLSAGAPGSVSFAALAASWVAMHEGVALLEPELALWLGAGMALPLVAGLPRLFAPRQREREMSASASWRALTAASLVLGLFPMTLLEALAPLEPTRASEYLLLRCGDLELVDLRRPRLRSELRLGCSDPVAELEAAFDPEPATPLPAPVTTTELYSELPAEVAP